MLWWKNRTAHFSVDDTIWMLENLGHFSYRSAFEQPTLFFFQRLHEQYGLKVSFYCFGSFQGLHLSEMTDTYRWELEKNNDWLRFGFHADSDISQYNCIESDRAICEYAFVCKELMRIAGEQSLDTICRIHNYSGSKDVLYAVCKETSLEGVLCAIGKKKGYYLSSWQNAWVNWIGQYVDYQTGVRFLNTDIQIEKTSLSEYANFQSCTGRHIEAFTHEWALNEETMHKIESFCAALKHQGYSWEFPNRRR